MQQSKVSPTHHVYIRSKGAAGCLYAIMIYNIYLKGQSLVEDFVVVLPKSAEHVIVRYACMYNRAYFIIYSMYASSIQTCQRKVDERAQLCTNWNRPFWGEIYKWSKYPRM